MSDQVLCMSHTQTADRLALWHLKESGLNSDVRGCWGAGRRKPPFFLFSLSLSHTHVTAEKTHSPWGLTERAASDLLKLDDMRVATQACENTMWHLGTQTVNHLLMYGVQYGTFAMCSFIQSAVLSVRPQRETKIAHCMHILRG